MFSDNLRKYRQAAGYKTSKAFANKLEIPYQTYVNYENGGREPKFDLLCRMAKELKITPNILLGFQMDEFINSKSFWQSTDDYQVQTMPDGTVHLSLPVTFDSRATLNDEGQIAYKTYKHHVVAFANKKMFNKFTSDVIKKLNGKTAEVRKNLCRTESLNALELFESQNIARGIPKNDLPFLETRRLESSVSSV